jgi:putative transcriptional regulator
MGVGLPRPLLRYAVGGVDGLRWRLVGPGIERADLIGRTPGLSAFMMRLGPGVRVPRHTHDGDELTLVLGGAYQDEIGRFATGDVADLNDATTHRPHAERDGPCLCLVIVDGRLRFSSPIARAIQRLVGF